LHEPGGAADHRIGGLICNLADSGPLIPDVPESGPMALLLTRLTGGIMGASWPVAAGGHNNPPP
jgi:hypothetical protein